MSDNISSNEHEGYVKMLDAHCAKLGEHFDTVHIFVTRHEGDRDQTRMVNRGSGTWFSRFGQIREWLIYEEERIRESARKTERSGDGA